MKTAKCDITAVRSLTMMKAQNKARELRKEGIPVSGSVFSHLMRESYSEAARECEDVSTELTEIQYDILKQICPACISEFTVKDESKQTS